MKLLLAVRASGKNHSLCHSGEARIGSGAGSYEERGFEWMDFFPEAKNKKPSFESTKKGF
jgi:hypothetical protein